MQREEKATVIEDPDFGTLTLDEEGREWLGECECHSGVRVAFSEPVRDDGETPIAPEKRRRLLWFRDNEAALRLKMVTDSVDLQDAWESNDTGIDLTIPQIVERLTPQEIMIFDDGRVIVLYDDDMMFGGHIVDARFDAEWVLTQVIFAG